MDMHPSISKEDFHANLAEVERSFGNAKLANTEENTDAVLDWLDKNTQHPDGKGVLPTVQNLKRCIAELHRAEELAWIVAPRTQEDIREQEDLKKYPEMLSQADVLRQSEDMMKAARIMSSLRRRTNTAGADLRSHGLKARIREGLTTFLNEFLSKNDITKNFTAAQASAFETLFNAEEQKLYGSR